MCHRCGPWSRPPVSRRTRSMVRGALAISCNILFNTIFCLSSRWILRPSRRSIPRATHDMFATTAKFSRANPRTAPVSRSSAQITAKMSRIGKQTIEVPDKTTVTIKGNDVTVKVRYFLFSPPRADFSGAFYLLCMIESHRWVSVAIWAFPPEFARRIHSGSLAHFHLHAFRGPRESSLARCTRS